MKRLLFVPTLALVSMVALPACARAQAWGSPGPIARQSSAQHNVQRVAFDNGFREGLRSGERDRRRGAAFHYQNERAFQRADAGYHRSFGHIDRYRQVFRDGFARGYRDGYQRYARTVRGPAGRGGPIGRGAYNPAVQAGFDDGYQKGLEDARKRRSFDVLRHKWYRQGDRHYQARFGSRQHYRDAYRDGFKTGYERGYREGRYR